MDPPLSYKVQPDGIFKEFFVIGIKIGIWKLFINLYSLVTSVIQYSCFCQENIFHHIFHSIVVLSLMTD